MAQHHNSYREVISVKGRNNVVGMVVFVVFEFLPLHTMPHIPYAALAYLLTRTQDVIEENIKVEKK